jgi:hypothetical protein
VVERIGVEVGAERVGAALGAFVGDVEVEDAVAVGLGRAKAELVDLGASALLITMAQVSALLASA